MTQLKTVDRIVFLDNLRYLMVLLVVVLHSAASYNNFVPWWPLKELNAHSIFFDVILLILDIFLMPVLFFIAGYFAISSFQTKGTRLFLKRKSVRLGVPLLLSIPLTGPSFAYLYHYTRHTYTRSTGFASYWLEYMKSAAEVKIGIIDSVDQFSHSHLWFMSLLLFFFVIFTLFAGSKKRSGDHAPQPARSGSSRVSIWIILAAAGAITTVSTFTANLLFASPANPDPWVTIGNLLIFQPARVISYVLYFWMGIYAFKIRWFTGSQIPGHPMVWTIFCFLLSVCMLFILRHLFTNFSLGNFLIYVTVRSYLCVTFLAAFTSWSVRHWNRPSNFHARLTANSYHIYIVHFLIVILLQLLMSGWTDGPVFIKFGIVTLASILFSYGISQYALRPYPRITVIGLYSIFIVMLMTIHPAGS